MPQLFEEIRRLVAEGDYLIGDHAWERLLERGIMEFQFLVAIRLPLPNGDDCKVVWSLLRREGVAKLVTAHLFGDEDFFEEG